MKLDELIEVLGEYPTDYLVPWGFSNPHSYRGYYECLAFEPTANVTVGAMLAAAESANGKDFQGWKGGTYSMHGGSRVYLASEGTTNPDDEELTASEVRRMVGGVHAYNATKDLNAAARIAALDLYEADVISRLDRDIEGRIRAALAKAMSGASAMTSSDRE